MGRHHRGGIIGEASLGRHHRGGIIKITIIITFTITTGGIWESSGCIWNHHWRHLGVIWMHLEPSGWHLRGTWESSGCIWNHHWRHLGIIWMHLEPSGWHLGGTWEASGRHLGDLASQGGPKVI